MIVLPPDAQADQLCEALARHGITAILAEDIRSAILSLKSNTVPILLLDLDMEGADLFLDTIVPSLCNPSPYTMAATGYFSSAARTDILNRGADACLEKPINADEVVAMIRAALRRANQFQEKINRKSPSLIRGEMLIDPIRRMVVMEGRSVELTKKEFDALYLLACHPGMVFSPSQIYSHVWNEEYEYTMTSVPDLISSIRKKLGLSIKDKRYLQTIYNAGYRFTAE